MSRRFVSAFDLKKHFDGSLNVRHSRSLPPALSRTLTRFHALTRSIIHSCTLSCTFTHTLLHFHTHSLAHSPAHTQFHAHSQDNFTETQKHLKISFSIFSIYFFSLKTLKCSNIQSLSRTQTHSHTFIPNRWLV